MGKIKYTIALFWLLGCALCYQSFGCDRHIRNNVVDTLISYIGVKELTGNNDGKEVEMFIASTGLDPKGQYPWCAALISYTFQANGLAVPKYSARAATWFSPEKVIPDKEAIEGDLFSLYYRKLGRIGHIGMYLKPYLNDTPYIVSGEGNTNAQGSREGNQAAKRFRPRSVIHNSANWIDKN
jgi:hypothetical protein